MAAVNPTLAMLLAHQGAPGQPTVAAPSAGMQNPGALMQLLMQLRQRGTLPNMPQTMMSPGIGSLQSVVPPTR